MITRTSSRKVTFTHPFRLTAFDTDQPAGTYEVTTEEEILDSVTMLACRRLSTQIELRHRGGNSAITEVVSIEPEELEAALARDADTASASSAQSRSEALGPQGKISAR